MMAKNTHYLRFVRYFYQTPMYQKSEWRSFDQMSIDWKSEVKVEQGRNGSTYSTSPIYGPLPQKSVIQIFDTLSIKKIHWNFAPSISGILNALVFNKYFHTMCLIWP